MPVGGLSEREFKDKKEQILRQIRAIKIQGLEADRRKEEWTIRTKEKNVETEQEKFRQAEIRFAIEQVKTQTLQENLREAQIGLQIAQVGVTSAGDRLNFEQQAASMQRDLYRQRLDGMTLDESQAEFDNTDRRADFRVLEMPVPGRRAGGWPNTN